MVQMTVGGRALDLDNAQVLASMHGVPPEDFRKHVVEVGQTVYPPKQVLATITGWDRQSFTTMEAQRVLTRVGFRCRDATKSESGEMTWAIVSPEESASTLDDRIVALEAALVVANQAIANLIARVDHLEGQK